MGLAAAEGWVDVGPAVYLHAETIAKDDMLLHENVSYCIAIWMPASPFCDAHAALRFCSTLSSWPTLKMPCMCAGLACCRYLSQGPMPLSFKI